MHLSHIPQFTIQNRNVHISVLNGALWDMGQVHCGICELGQYYVMWIYKHHSIAVKHTIYVYIYSPHERAVKMIFDWVTD